ncbi:hypothetical protein AAT19DRAFT_12469 [Rhodotorula toruloides]|uniref:Uncharacterized protein n=1 Tax=Rhodotorula toruloides TaxID=5286 RepID=A0A2T0AGB4_RHOTO|nr:hypothetical protein AAT19DRAFT_12469 [Rhodotorula toruloides]
MSMLLTVSATSRPAACEPRAIASHLADSCLTLELLSEVTGHQELLHCFARYD